MIRYISGLILAVLVWNTSYQTPRLPNAPAAMMLIHLPIGWCSNFYVLKCVRTVPAGPPGRLRLQPVL